MAEPMASEPGADPGSEAVVQGSGPGWYLQEAIRIARFDTAAIRRAARDPMTLLYGGVIAAIAVFLRLAVTLIAPAAEAPPGLGSTSLLMAVVFVPAQLAVNAFNTAVLHGAGKILFGATGTYLGLLRALWLGSLVQWLIIIPVIGWLVSAVWSLLLMLITFEEVDGIERLQALALAVGFIALTSLISLVFF